MFDAVPWLLLFIHAFHAKNAETHLPMNVPIGDDDETFGPKRVGAAGGHTDPVVQRDMLLWHVLRRDRLN
jgi:hypothetical protein